MAAENVSETINGLGITYAVEQNNNGETWEANQASFWPTLYLIDIKGNVRYSLTREGVSKETETESKIF